MHLLDILTKRSFLDLICKTKDLSAIHTGRYKIMNDEDLRS